jgi:hypothetical protein
MRCIVGHEDLQGLRRLLLLTSDAHGLYSQFGFEQLGNPSRSMEVLGQTFTGRLDGCVELEPFPFRWNRNGAAVFCFDALSAREPALTLLENAGTVLIRTIIRASPVA